MAFISRTDVLNTFFENFQKSLFTGTVGHILTFNPVTQRAQVQIGITRVDTLGYNIDPNPIGDVPVLFLGSDQFIFETEMSEGTEGLILFSQRSLDGWKQTGGIALNPSSRFHHMQDAIFVPGVRSLKTVFENFSNDGVKLRNKAGDQFFWLKKDGSIISQNSKSSITQNADGSASMVNGKGNFNLKADGTVTVNGVTIDPSGNLIMPSGSTITDGNGVIIETHRHPYSDGITGEPEQ